MDASIATSTLPSNRGHALLEIHCFDYNEENLLLDLSIRSSEQGNDPDLLTNIDGGLSLQIPQVVCRRSAFTSFLNSLREWIALPLPDLAESNLNLETELRAVDYTFRDSLIFSIQAPEITRTTGDQRYFEPAWTHGKNQVRYGFQIDVTGVTQFCGGLNRMALT